MIRILVLILFFTTLSTVNIFAGTLQDIPETDSGDFQLAGFFDLRDRESFIQITNTDSDPSGRTIHIQLFDVNNLCNENNFFDNYTPNDTHVYNIRDIITNDGNPSGVVLPSNAYGVFFATYLDADPVGMIGNLRIEDNNGYEYRTNLNGTGENNRDQDSDPPVWTFNYNTLGGVTLSDVIGIHVNNIGNTSPPAEVIINPAEEWIKVDVDIYDLNETPFSCRDVVFACINEESPRLEELLEDAGASVASFEYGINEVVPSSKGAELLCPGNVITEGLVSLVFEDLGGSEGSPKDSFVVFAGLNNGNGRGSMDSVWYSSTVIDFD